MTTIDIALRKPHTPLQRSMITHPGSVVSFCGRRYGKTDGNVQRIFYWMQRKPGMYWWVGLSWRSASLKRAWREVSNIARKILAALGLPERGHINRASFEVKIPGMGEIWFRTADNPASLAGEGIQGVILDEFSLMQEIVWTEYVQATLIDYSGWAAFSGVPKGNNWASALWRGAADKNDWLQVHATSYDNPFNETANIDAIRDDLNTPEFFFRQEYMAEILSAEGQVFRRITDAAILEPIAEPIADRQYIAGVDVADKMDFTVVSVFDVASKEQVYIDRFHRVGYPILEDRLYAVYNRFKIANMIIEDNSIGQVVIDHLRQRGMMITQFNTSHATKQPLIQQLSAAFEHGNIRIINDPIQVGELQSYESQRTASGFSYSAPAGMHDDTVTALAFAWYGLSRRRSIFV